MIYNKNYMNIKMHFGTGDITMVLLSVVLNIGKVLLNYRQTSYFPIDGMSSLRVTSTGPSSPWCY